MRKALTLVGAIILILYSNVALATEPNQFTEDFFKELKTGKISQAYDNLFKGSGIPQVKPQAVEVLKSQTASLFSFFGSVLGYEKIKEENIGNSIVRIVYVLKHEKAPTSWQFYFYRPKDSWFIGHVTFNDQFQNLQ